MTAISTHPSRQLPDNAMQSNPLLPNLPPWTASPWPSLQGEAECDQCVRRNRTLSRPDYQSLARGNLTHRDIVTFVHSMRLNRAEAVGVRVSPQLARDQMPARHRAQFVAPRRLGIPAPVETGDMLARLGEVVRGLRLDPARMRRNLDLGGGADHGRGGDAGAGGGA